MSSWPTLLKVLLHQRHWQTYSTFCNEYDRAASEIDRRLVGSWPSRAQLHRWQSGDLKKLPYAHHCRVLEQMFQGRTAQELFAPCPDGLAESLTAQTDDNGAASPPGQASAPVGAPAVPAIGIRPYIERAFEQEHVPGLRRDR